MRDRRGKKQSKENQGKIKWRSRSLNSKDGTYRGRVGSTNGPKSHRRIEPMIPRQATAPSRYLEERPILVSTQ